MKPKSLRLAVPALLDCRLIKKTTSSRPFAQPRFAQDVDAVDSRHHDLAATLIQFAAGANDGQHLVNLPILLAMLDKDISLWRRQPRRAIPPGRNGNARGFGVV